MNSAKNGGKNWCWKCGSILNKKYVDMHYDPTTGKQECNIIWKCPNFKWYNNFIWGHSKFKSDENGNTYSFES